MKIFLSFLFLLVTMNARATCQFRPEIKKVISLSGPMTVLLQEMGLIEQHVVKGISVFSPVSAKTYKGKLYPGGVFLAPSTLEEFSFGLVFFDESRDLKKILKSNKNINAVEIKTRHLLPMDVVDHSMVILKSYVSGCDIELKLVKKRAIGIQRDLLQRVPDGMNVIFFLGEIRGSRLPELVVVNDGIVKLLLQEKKINTYPSELSYINWSPKIMSSMPSKTLLIGLVDSGMKGVKKVETSSNKTNLFYPGSLVPGLTQLEAFHFWLKSL